MSFNIDDCRWPADPWPASEPGVPFARIYEDKHRLALLLRPQIVAEIGVRAGYSAAAFLAAGATSYLGFDCGDVGGSGGTPGALAFARTMLPVKFPDRCILIVERDTQQVRPGELPAHNADLFHVDGDHSFKGSFHDLELALACRPKWILIDDVEHHADTVGAAVAVFLQRHALHHVMLDTVRGDCLIQVRR